MSSSGLSNDDDYCFKCCAYCGFHEVYKKDHPQSMYHCTKLAANDNFIKWDGVEFPASNEDIHTFEAISDNKLPLASMPRSGMQLSGS